jgi:hypothetical protein
LQTGKAWHLLAAGALMGLAITMKQQAVPLAVMAIVLTLPAVARGPPLVTAGHRRNVIADGAGAGDVRRPRPLLVLDLSVRGAYVSEVPLSMASAVLRMAWLQITHATGWFWYAAVLGVALLVLTRWPASTRRSVFAWLIGSAAAVVPGFFFRPHYFILLMPVAAILVGIAIASIDRVLARSIGAVGARVIALLIVAGLGLSYVQRDSDYLFRMSGTDLVRSLYAENPFLEAPEIGRYIATHTKPAIGSPCSVRSRRSYFYANRPSATGYIYAYPLMEPQPYARRMARSSDRKWKQQGRVHRPFGRARVWASGRVQTRRFSRGRGSTRSAATSWPASPTSIRAARRSSSGTRPPLVMCPRRNRRSSLSPEAGRLRRLRRHRRWRPLGHQVGSPCMKIDVSSSPAPAAAPSRMPSTTTQIFIGLVIGILIGYIWPSHDVDGKPRRRLRRADQAAGRHLPADDQDDHRALLFSTLVIGIAGTGDLKAMGRIGLKGDHLFEVATTIALFLGPAIVNIFQPGVGVQVPNLSVDSLKGVQAIPMHSGWDMLVSLFPTSVIDSMARGDILQVVVFSIFFGIGLAAMGERGRPLIDVLESTAQVMFKFTATS